MARVFSILTLPRCRSAWLANFLDYPPCHALHEPSRFYPATNWALLRQALEAQPVPWACIVDPSATGLDPEGWAAAFGDAPVGYIRRPLASIVNSLYDAGAEPGAEERVEKALRGMESLQGAYPGPELSWGLGPINVVALATFLGKLAPGLPFGEGRAQALRGMRVTVIPEVRYST